MNFRGQVDGDPFGRRLGKTYAKAPRLSFRRV
jgi:hypothetical protein